MSLTVKVKYIYLHYYIKDGKTILIKSFQKLKYVFVREKWHIAYLGIKFENYFFIS